MSDNVYNTGTRRKNQTLLIVEGDHEKNHLFQLLFECFDINIDSENVWIYGTNIYVLYEDIVREYGDNWADEKMDIDLPLVISKKSKHESLRYRRDFSNIILVFDYERHDPKFSEKKIMDMQVNFSDMTYMGQLYINYPMIESYQHLKELPDSDYLERRIPVSVRPGKKYKELVNRETAIKHIVDFAYKVTDLLNEYYGITDESLRHKCCQEIFEISDAFDVVNTLRDILKNIVEDGRRETLVYQLNHWISKIGYLGKKMSYWEYARWLFKEIIYHNICKANYIQSGHNEMLKKEKYKACFENLDLADILKIQNSSSEDESKGYIWVLNTCVFFVAEYQFDLVQK